GEGVGQGAGLPARAPEGRSEGRAPVRGDREARRRREMSGARPTRSVAALSCAALLALGASCQTIKNAMPSDTTSGRAVRAGADVGQAWSDTQISEEDQKEIGRGVAGQLIATYGLCADEGLTHYVELVGNVVASASDRPDSEFHFGVLDTMDVNAFSTPG